MKTEQTLPEPSGPSAPCGPRLALKPHAPGRRLFSDTIPGAGALAQRLQSPLSGQREGKPVPSTSQPRPASARGQRQARRGCLFPRRKPPGRHPTGKRSRSRAPPCLRSISTEVSLVVQACERGPCAGGTVLSPRGTTGYLWGQPPALSALGLRGGALGPEPQPRGSRSTDAWGSSRGRGFPTPSARLRDNAPAPDRTGPEANRTSIPITWGSIGEREKISAPGNLAHPPAGPGEHKAPPSPARARQHPSPRQCVGQEDLRVP